MDNKDLKKIIEDDNIKNDDKLLDLDHKEETFHIDKEYEEYLKESEDRYKNEIEYKMRSDYYDEYHNNEINEKMIMYEAYFGRGLIDNSAALFHYMLNDIRFEDYIHVWSLERGPFRNKIIEKYKDHPNVIFVETFTKRYYKYLSQAKYLINNVTWQNYFIKKEGQIYINPWHGIPIKHLGYSVPDGDIEVANTIRNFLMTDYIISPLPYMTDLFKKSYKLEGLFDGKIIETGQPRVDVTYHAKKEDVIKELKSYGIKYDPSKKLILYAPTFRGKYGKDDVDVDEFERFLKTIKKYIDLNEYQILFKPHQIVYQALIKNNLLKDNYIPALMDTNALLSITDILISDYSSIFFDFLVTNRPILFYITDLEKYKKERGLYLLPEDLPGPVTNNLKQLAKWINEIKDYKTFFDYQKYENAKKNYTSNDDGNVCKRVIDAIFFNDKKYHLSINNNKKRLLFHIDTCKKNGITSALVNLMNALDKDKYDITFYAIGTQIESRKVFKTINPNIRIMRRIGTYVLNPEDDAKINYGIDHAITVLDNSPYFPKAYYESEYRRMFGDAKFDYLIYFSGYSAFWANFYSLRKKEKRFIWMHNVVENEYKRAEEGEYRFARNLNSIYKLYSIFDGCVSCSKTTMLENIKDLNAKGFKGNYMYVRNLFNADHVLKGKQDYLHTTIDNKRYFVEKEEYSDEYTLVPLPDKKKKTFISMGRITKEKQQQLLVKAFSRIHLEYPNTELYLIGDGEDLENVIREIAHHDLFDNVILTGNINNPFAILNEADCFILPSLYEGQPMVLLEARVLKLPIIVSNFSTVADSSYENGQLIIGQTEDEIYNGMKLFMKGKIKNEYHLDIKKHNQKGIEEFEACLKQVSDN